MYLHYDAKQSLLLLYIFLKCVLFKPGRPCGTTNERKRLIEKSEFDLKNQVAYRYQAEVDSPGRLLRTKKALFQNILETKMQNYDVGDDFWYPYLTMLARINRDSLDGNGSQSPMSRIEPKLIQLILCMSNIKRTLTVSEGLMLANDLIAGTKTQEDLIKWKTKKKIYHNDDSTMGTVGWNYFRGFLKRHEYDLRGKKLSSYNIDCANFTNFLIFFDMYLHIEEILLKSKVATKFDEPVWKDELGVTVDSELDTMGYKCTIDITHPHLCIVMDECGCNLSQEGDNNNGGELYLTGVKDKAYNCTTNRHCHFTLIPVSLLNGELLMCVIIISGKRHDVLVELGVDTTKLGSLTSLNDKEVLTLDDNIKLLENNIGTGKVFPQAPT